MESLRELVSICLLESAKFRLWFPPVWTANGKFVWWSHFLPFRAQKCEVTQNTGLHCLCYSTHGELVPGNQGCPLEHFPSLARTCVIPAAAALSVLSSQWYPASAGNLAPGTSRRHLLCDLPAGEIPGRSFPWETLGLEYVRKVEVECSGKTSNLFS